MFCTITLTVAATTEGTKPPTGVTATATTPPPMEFSEFNMYMNNFNIHPRVLEKRNSIHTYQYLIKMYLTVIVTGETW